MLYEQMPRTVDRGLSLVDTTTDRLELDRCTQIVVQRHWSDWRHGAVYASDLQDLHWLQPTGVSRPLLHAYVLCTRLRSGEVPHRCDPHTAPHRLLVCILKRHTVGGVYDELSRRADERKLDS